MCSHTSRHATPLCSPPHHATQAVPNGRPGPGDALRPLSEAEQAWDNAQLAQVVRESLLGIQAAISSGSNSFIPPLRRSDGGQSFGAGQYRSSDARDSALAHVGLLTAAAAAAASQPQPAPATGDVRWCAQRLVQLAPLLLQRGCLPAVTASIVKCSGKVGTAVTWISGLPKHTSGALQWCLLGSHAFAWAPWLLFYAPILPFPLPAAALLPGPGRGAAGAGGSDDAQHPFHCAPQVQAAVLRMLGCQVCSQDGGAAGQGRCQLSGTEQYNQCTVDCSPRCLPALVAYSRPSSYSFMLFVPCLAVQSCALLSCCQPVTAQVVGCRSVDAPCALTWAFIISPELSHERYLTGIERKQPWFRRSSTKAGLR